jgi:hypothetical protein
LPSRQDRRSLQSFLARHWSINGNLNTAKMLERFGREDDAIRYYEAAAQSIR